MSGVDVRVAGVARRYAGGGGLGEVSLDVAAGESVVVFGRSGSGKTTLLRLIAGLERPDAGEIWLAERLVSAGRRTIVPANERRVGFVFQDLALWPHLTVRGNLEFVVESAGIDRAERQRRIDDVMQLCHVEAAFGGRYPHQLSGGEQQRVAMARALASAPRLLLLDEPFSSLDPDLRATLRNELASLQRQLGVTAIYVTHDRADADAVASRVFTLPAVNEAEPPARAGGRT